MTESVDVSIFDWDKYSPDDLVQKDGSFQLGLALLPALMKSGRVTACGARATLYPPKVRFGPKRRLIGGPPVW
jgi:hypothetical protein